MPNTELRGLTGTPLSKTAVFLVVGAITEYVVSQDAGYNGGEISSCRADFSMSESATAGELIPLVASNSLEGGIGSDGVQACSCRMTLSEIGAGSDSGTIGPVGSEVGASLENIAVTAGTRGSDGAVAQEIVPTIALGNKDTSAASGEAALASASLGAQEAGAAIGEANAVYALLARLEEGIGADTREAFTARLERGEAGTASESVPTLALHSGEANGTTGEQIALKAETHAEDTALAPLEARALIAEVLRTESSTSDDGRVPVIGNEGAQDQGTLRESILQHAAAYQLLESGASAELALVGLSTGDTVGSGETLGSLYGYLEFSEDGATVESSANFAQYAGGDTGSAIGDASALSAALFGPDSVSGQEGGFSLLGGIAVSEGASAAESVPAVAATKSDSAVGAGESVSAYAILSLSDISEGDSLAAELLASLAGADARLECAEASTSGAYTSKADHSSSTEAQSSSASSAQSDGASGAEAALQHTEIGSSERDSEIFEGLVDLLCAATVSEQALGAEFVAQAFAEIPSGDAMVGADRWYVYSSVDRRDKHYAMAEAGAWVGVPRVERGSVTERQKAELSPAHVGTVASDKAKAPALPDMGVSPLPKGTVSPYQTERKR